ncbi:hypothetical protein AAVH_08320 [Aphelenchoides avenae]|nr:hypothetical protein AAVH_08320 [Aphelenchus avenae]
MAEAEPAESVSADESSASEDEAKKDEDLDALSQTELVSLVQKLRVSRRASKKRRAKVSERYDSLRDEWEEVSVQSRALARNLTDIHESLEDSLQMSKAYVRQLDDLRKEFDEKKHAGSDEKELKSQECLEAEAARIISAVVKELHEEHKKVERELLMLSGLAVEVEGLCGQDE